ncbi:hypothetical protein [Streptomyces sp. NBC_00344]|uniref:hypothetical protein n=1 Tax=Streptomyces sp. NBC_00344 TaxID=2975720 RepID=UPI002E1F51FC
MLVITPFATDVIGGNGAFQVRFVFYAAVQFTARVLFVLMLREIRRDDLYRMGTPPEVFPLAVHRRGLVAVAFLIPFPSRSSPSGRTRPLSSTRNEQGDRGRRSGGGCRRRRRDAGRW